MISEFGELSPALFSEPLLWGLEETQKDKVYGGKFVSADSGIPSSEMNDCASFF